MIAIIATSALLAVGSASAMEQPEMKEAWETIGAWEACKGKEEAEMCEYAPHNIEGNYLFSYTHKEQNEKSLTEVLPERGIARKDWYNMLVIWSQYKKPMDVNALSLPDPFDGPWHPSDFPVKVFLKETKRGQCWGRLAEKRMCVGVRSLLVEACNGKQVGDKCSYDSLELEKKYLDKDHKEKMSFWGECQAAKVPEGEEGWSWCKLETPRQQEIEACLGKLPGKVCEYAGEHEKDVNQGICMGAPEGNTLACQGGNKHMIEACKGKARGEECKCNHGMHGKEFKGWCGYTETAMQCMNDEMKPKPRPKPEEPGHTHPDKPGGDCADLKKEVWATRMVVNNIAKKVGAATGPPPTLGPKPTAPPKPVDGRRRSRRRRSPKPTDKPGGVPDIEGPTTRRRSKSRRRRTAMRPE